MKCDDNEQYSKSKVINSYLNNSNSSYSTLTKCFLVCIVCSAGYYGMDCKGRCSGHCINNEPCDRVSGVCTRGCQNGFVGTYCNHCKTCLQLFLKFVSLQILFAVSLDINDH